MRNKIAIIIIFVAVIGGFGALSNFFGIVSYSKAAAYQPYIFNKKDQVELVITKFIRAIEIGDIRTAALSIEKDRNYHTIIKNITGFYNKYNRKQAEKHILIYPQELVLSDSIAVMRFKIKNTLRYNENKEAKLVLVKKENQWLIQTSSSFFKVLIVLNNNEKEKENSR